MSVGQSVSQAHRQSKPCTPSILPARTYPSGTLQHSAAQHAVMVKWMQTCMHASLCVRQPALDWTAGARAPEHSVREE